MALSLQDTKLLWGRAANRCSICKTELSQNKKNANKAFPLGEQAHIIAEEKDGPRGESILTLEERNSYPNIILLCPTCHTIIDKNIEDYPIEILHQLKTNHELYVQQKLSSDIDSKNQAIDIIYSNLVDKAVELLNLENWKGWTSCALAPNPYWPKDLPEKIFQFREIIIAANWPKVFEELERSLITLSIICNEASQRFLEHSEERDELIVGIRFYKIRDFTEEEYNQRLKEYNSWVDKCGDLIFKATKAVNWFSDVVRRDINPMFYATEGKFVVTYGPFMDLSFKTELLQFTDDEKRELPESLFKVDQEEV